MSFRTELYSKLYLARAAELGIIKYYHENEMKTPMHMSYGQEIAPVGVCQALRKEDQVFGTYRSHALYLAKSGNLIRFFGEMYGKTNGMVCGKAGSMHMSDAANGFMGASAIVASTIPVAVGAAFAQKYKGTDNISVSFFGDGAADEGDFWESVNIATSMQLPILFVLEHNKYAVHTISTVRHGYNDICLLMRNYRFSSVTEVNAVNFPDVELVYSYAHTAIESIRQSGRPAFLCIHLERGLEHVGISSDYDVGYRAKPDAEDAVAFYRKVLVNEVGEEEVTNIENNINQQVEDAIKQAKEASFPSNDELYNGVYA